MNSRVIEKEALDLPASKRAGLAQRLLESLDDLSETEADELWRAEIARRVEEIDSGKVKLVSSDQLEKRVRARLK